MSSKDTRGSTSTENVPSKGTEKQQVLQGEVIDPSKGRGDQTRAILANSSQDNNSRETWDQSKAKHVADKVADTQRAGEVLASAMVGAVAGGVIGAVVGAATALRTSPSGEAQPAKAVTQTERLNAVMERLARSVESLLNLPEKRAVSVDLPSGCGLHLERVAGEWCLNVTELDAFGHHVRVPWRKCSLDSRLEIAICLPTLHKQLERALEKEATAILSAEKALQLLESALQRKEGR